MNVPLARKPLFSSTLIRTALCASLLLTPLAQAAFSQQPGKQQPATAQDDDTDTAPTPTRTPAQSTVAENLDTAWSLLTSALADTKHTDRRIQALAAIGTLGASPRAEKMIADAFKDPDLDVRTAAILAAGESKNRNLTTPLRRMLDDKEPQVAFSAATTLWKMGDHSGEDILMAVVDGERKPGATLVNGAMHTANEDLHNPSTLAKIGALQGASMLLGPFGFGITAYEYIRKNGGDSSRVNALEAISQEKTEPIRKELVAALGDKDPGVRAAAAKALASYHLPDVSISIAHLFDDTKPPVRFTAASAYLISTNASPASPNPNEKKATAHRK